ncbi:hypothetical protein [Klebsiella quasipneumoniae]|uniref:hypothetical protein n=1 Tax=Klebsiella quasipneumoniae TaxID=1463165 RepID=UPI003F1B52AC
MFFLQLVQQISDIYDHLLNKDWYLLETKPEHPFYVSGTIRWYWRTATTSVRTAHIGSVLRITNLPFLSSTLMLAMYCPSIREQKIRDKQDLHHLLARAPHLIPRHMRPFEMLRHLSRFTDYHLMPLTADHVTH